MSTSRSAWRVEKTEAVSPGAMITAAHPLAAEAGISMIESGGNAMDGAVAASLAAGVVEPYHTGLGGIASILYFDATTQRTVVIDGTSTLPTSLQPEAFEIADPCKRVGAYGWPAVKGDANNTGYLSFITPTALLAYGEALDRFGRFGLDRVLEPAISFAGRGFEVDWYLAGLIASQQRRLGTFPQTARTFFLSDGACPSANWYGQSADLLVQPDLAGTLEIVASEGPTALYEGTLAERLANDVAVNHGFLSETDLSNAAVGTWTEPLACSFRNWAVHTLPRNTGGPTLVEALNILSGFDLAGGQSESRRSHLIGESLRRAFLDRFQHLGDPAMEPVPLAGLVSEEFASIRRRSISVDRADPGASAGDPWPFEEGRGGAGESSPTAANWKASDDTTNVTVVDQDRNAAVITSTVGSSFGSGVVAGDTGILMNNGTMWFNPVRGAFNSLSPGRRNVVAGTPVLLFRDGRLVMAGGAAGGRKIISAMLQVILNVVEFGMNVHEAVASPRIHCEGRTTFVDSALGGDVIADLESLGHELSVRRETIGTSEFARPNAIHIGDDGMLRSGMFPYSLTTAIGI